MRALYITVDMADRMRSLTPSASHMALQPPRVLLVDDELAVRAALGRFFTKRGWTVVDAEDGERAKAMLEQSFEDAAFDLMICDLRMPRLSGVELYEWLARTRPLLLDRLILSSGDLSMRDTADFLADVRCRLLHKPFELHELTRLIEELAPRAAASARGGRSSRVA
jgi:DNA-binding response OmpR family regulator